MYCRNCGKQVDDKAVVCIHCGCAPRAENKYCSNCGSETQTKQTICTNCGVALKKSEEKSKVAAGLFAIFLGAFAVHKFYLGYTKEAIIILMLFWGGLILLGLPSLVIGIIVFIEGIIYLTKSDEEFQRIYVQDKRGWF